MPLPELIPLTPESTTSYDNFVRQAVQAALDDPRPGIPHEEAERYFTLKRAALLQRSKSD
ncbi:antitoxin PaaA2 family protein [Chromobacterium haemolyticum]|uniref:antitoxin PaaA2 family protein n=1 Tax=Chromobacterium haemolyticum TaxID=394935 RepID=UPI004056D0AF